VREESGVRRLVSGWKKWRVHPKWYLLAFSPIVIFFLSAWIYLAFGGIAPGLNPDATMWLNLPLLAIITIFTGATGEELGWRGFALPRLQRKYSAVTASVLLGFFWGVWHIPVWILFNSPFTFESTFLFVAGTIFYSVVITCICNNTKGSVLLASIFHWNVNAGINFVTIYLGLIPWNMMIWISTVLFALLSLILILHYGPKNLSRNLANGYPELAGLESESQETT
jgi:membrane protease YdiL (CAAX protease family)